MEVIMSISKHANKKKNILIAASEIVKEEGVVKLTLEAVAQREFLNFSSLFFYQQKSLNQPV